MKNFYDAKNIYDNFHLVFLSPFLLFYSFSVCFLMFFPLLGFILVPLELVVVVVAAAVVGLLRAAKLYRLNNNDVSVDTVSNVKHLTSILFRLCISTSLSNWVGRPINHHNNSVITITVVTLPTTAIKKTTSSRAGGSKMCSWRKKYEKTH